MKTLTAIPAVGPLKTAAGIASKKVRPHWQGLVSHKHVQSLAAEGKGKADVT